MNFCRVTYLIIFIVFSISCKESKTVKSGLWGKSKSIVGELLSLDSAYMRYPFRILQTDSSVCILDLHGSDYYCHRFNNTDFKFEKSFAARGNGPAEFLDAENMRLDCYGNFYVLDANKSEISFWKRNAPDTIVRIKLSKKLVRTLDFAIVDDSTFVLPDYTGNNRFVFINRMGLIISKQYKIPVRSKKNTATISLAQAWRSFIDYNPENGILAMATQLGDVVELYDLKADTIINIVYGENGEPEYIDKGSYAVPNGIMGYSDVHVGSKNIYALFWGRSFKEIRNNKDVTEGGNKLRVFDLKGNPICEYILDKYITGFCIDEKDNTMLALDINSNNHLVKYQL